MSDKSISNISRLSKLSVSEAEAERLQKDLDQILGYIKKLDEIDVSQIEAFYHPHDMTLRLRADRVEKVAGTDALTGSRGYEARFIRVPRIIE